MHVVRSTMKNNDEDQNLEVQENIEIEKTDDEAKEEEEADDTFVYFKSSSIISILIIVIISLVCVLATSLVIRTALHSRGITRRLSLYFGFTSNRTIDESILTFWQPTSINDQPPIETITPAIIDSSPPPITLTAKERRAQQIFKNFILPTLLLSSILCGILAFYMRLHHDRYPAWGARPKKPGKYITIELKQAKPNESV